MIVTNKYNIDVRVIDILRLIREKTSLRGDLYLRDIRDEEPAIMVTCPFHKNHSENKPSCGVFVAPYKGFNEGDFHCFACGAKGNITRFVGTCLHMSDEDAEEWLHSNFGGGIINGISLPKIELNNSPKKPKKYITKSALKQFDYYHPYTDRRGLSRETVDKFGIGYDPLRDAITFPVWDEKGTLLFVTARSVNSKRFFIPKEADKPLYLFNFVNKINPPIMMITEGQIDALTAWQYGFPCCATMGSISENQINTLNKCGIRIFIDAFDNDEWGEKFSKTLQNRLRKDLLIYRIPFPPGKKDLNDLTEEEFNQCLNKLGIDWRLNKEISNGNN